MLQCAGTPRVKRRPIADVSEEMPAAIDTATTSAAKRRLIWGSRRLARASEITSTVPGAVLMSGELQAPVLLF